MATKMIFTDSGIQRIKHTEKAEWCSDKTYRGLRLCITSGSKTWYASKWDGAAQKSRQIKIGQFPKMKPDEAWRIACEVKAEMDAGEHMSRAEKATKAVEEDAAPTDAGRCAWRQSDAPDQPAILRQEPDARRHREGIPSQLRTAPIDLG